MIIICHVQNVPDGGGTADDGGAECEAAAVRVPGWVCDPSADLAVTFTPRALAQLAALDEARLQLLRSRAELRAAITQVLSTDPRQDHYVL